MKISDECKELLKVHPPPYPTLEFKKYWVLFLPDIVGRDNFRPAHLEQLKTLCHLCVEQDVLVDTLEVTGWYYNSETDKGNEIIRPRPELKQLKECRTQIAMFSKMLGLLLVKDTAPSGAKGKGIASEWE